MSYGEVSDYRCTESYWTYLDFKNPNKEEEDLGDPKALLEKYHKAAAAVDELQNSVIGELKKILEGE